MPYLIELLRSWFFDMEARIRTLDASVLFGDLDIIFENDQGLGGPFDFGDIRRSHAAVDDNHMSGLQIV